MINVFKRMTLIGAILVSANALAWNNGLTLQDTKKLSLDAKSLTALNVEAGAGFLTIVGNQTDSINVKAEIYQYEAHSNYCLSLKNKNDLAELIANNCKNNKEQTRIDLTVSIPKTYQLHITDGSGAISIENTASTSIVDGSGEINIKNLAGMLTIEDGSGAIKAHNIDGKIVINDGSGSIELANSNSDVKIHDGSGNIDVTNTLGAVTITDGSGGIYVDTAQSFTLIADGSGRVKIENVENIER